MNTINEQEVIHDYLHTNMRLYEIREKYGLKNFHLYKIFKKHNVKRYRNIKYKLTYPNGRGLYNKLDKKYAKSKDYYNAPAIFVRNDGIVIACGIGIPVEEQPKLSYKEYVEIAGIY